MRPTRARRCGWPLPAAITLLADGLPYNRLAALDTRSDPARARARFEQSLAIRERLAAATDDAGDAYNLACTRARLGAAAAALSALERAVSLGFTNADHAASDADLASLQADPRFHASLEAMRERHRAAPA